MSDHIVVCVDCQVDFSVSLIHIFVQCCGPIFSSRSSMRIYRSSKCLATVWSLLLSGLASIRKNSYLRVKITGCPRHRYIPEWLNIKESQSFLFLCSLRVFIERWVYFCRRISIQWRGLEATSNTILYAFSSPTSLKLWREVETYINLHPSQHRHIFSNTTIFLVDRKGYLSVSMPTSLSSSPSFSFLKSSGLVRNLLIGIFPGGLEEKYPSNFCILPG